MTEKKNEKLEKEVVETPVQEEKKAPKAKTSKKEEVAKEKAEAAVEAVKEVVVEEEKKEVAAEAVVEVVEEKAKVVVIAGKHAGERGTLVKLKPERKMASLSIDKKDANILIKQIVVTD